MYAIIEKRPLYCLLFFSLFVVLNLFVCNVGKQLAKEMSSPTKKKKPELSTTESIASMYHLLDGQGAQLASSSASASRPAVPSTVVSPSEVVVSSSEEDVLPVGKPPLHPMLFGTMPSCRLW